MIGLDEMYLNKCYTCGRHHGSVTTLIKKKCTHTGERSTYCDDWCYAWRYFDPKYDPKRLAVKLFGRG